MKYCIFKWLACHWRSLLAILIIVACARIGIQVGRLLHRIPTRGMGSAVIQLTSDEMQGLEGILGRHSQGMSELIKGKKLEFRVETAVRGLESALWLDHAVEIVEFVDADGNIWDSDAKAQLAGACTSELVAFAVLAQGMTNSYNIQAGSDSLVLEATRIAWRNQWRSTALLLLIGSGTVVISVVIWRRSAGWRMARGQCVHCGYDTSGLPPGALCPECGR